MYRVVVFFTDIEDGGHKYKEGDAYPREGLEVTPERIAALLSGDNLRKIPLIEELPDPEQTTVAAQKATAPKQKATTKAAKKEE